MKKSILASLLVFLALGAAAQTENPRGIYRLMTLIGKSGEVNSPYHQYKVCTDSLTLMVVFQRDNVFSMSNNDRKVFNYTGDQPKSDDDKSILIYDSNAEHFTMKWWSDYPYHMIFPQNDWCVEKYQSGQYTKESRIAFEALTGKAGIDAKNPLTGTWRLIGEVDELRDLKKGLSKLHEKYPSSRYFNTFMILSPKNVVRVNGSGGFVVDAVYDGKKEKYREFGEMLFTHFGVSGPVILSASAVIGPLLRKKELKLCIDLKPALTEEQLDQRILRDFSENLNRELRNSLSALLPAKMIPEVIAQSGIAPGRRVHDITREERAALVRALKKLSFTLIGLRGYNEAVITKGGVSVKEVNPSTMESKKVQGLYFAGEILDLDAMTGGFNLQIAWSTGYLAGKNAAAEE